MRVLIQALAITVVVGMTGRLLAQEKNLTPGQEKIKELAFMIGDWQFKNEEGTVETVSNTLINNDSFIQSVHGSVRVIIGWDLEEKKFAEWTFGGEGGHGKALWEKKGDSWYIEYKPYYLASGKAVTNVATLTPTGKDSMRVTGQFVDGKFDIQMTRLKGK